MKRREFSCIHLQKALYPGQKHTDMMDMEDTDSVLGTLGRRQESIGGHYSHTFTCSFIPRDNPACVDPGAVTRQHYAHAAIIDIKEYRTIQEIPLSLDKGKKLPGGGHMIMFPVSVLALPERISHNP